MGYGVARSMGWRRDIPSWYGWLVVHENIEKRDVV